MCWARDRFADDFPSKLDSLGDSPQPVLPGSYVIGLMGGTFDPVHIGHLRVAVEAAEALRLHRLHLIPCGEPVHRKPPDASGPERLRMLELAVAGDAVLRADGRELARPGPSYTIDTLADLRVEYGPVAPICMLIGADAFSGLASWHRWRELLDLSHVIVMSRPGVALPGAGEVAELLRDRQVDFPEQLVSRPAGGVCRLNVSRLDVSSSAVRELVARQISPRFLITDSVFDFIRSHNLYGYRGASC